MILFQVIIKMDFAKLHIKVDTIFFLAIYLRLARTFCSIVCMSSNGEGIEPDICISPHILTFAFTTRPIP